LVKVRLALRVIEHVPPIELAHAHVAVPAVSVGFRLATDPVPPPPPAPPARQNTDPLYAKVYTLPAARVVLRRLELHV
jgi:hypothetical protein